MGVLSSRLHEPLHKFVGIGEQEGDNHGSAEVDQEGRHTEITEDLLPRGPLVLMQHSQHDPGSRFKGRGAEERPGDDHRSERGRAVEVRVQLG